MSRAGNAAEKSTINERKQMVTNQNLNELLTSPDARARLQGVHGLSKAILDDPSSLERLRALVDKLVADPSPFVRWNLAVALGETRRSEVVLWLERLAADEHANVRFRAALALGTIGDVERARPILDRLAKDTYEVGGHRVVRAFAALGFGRLGDARGTGQLAELAKDEDGVVRWHAAVALGDIRSPDGVPALVTLLGDAIPFVRAHAAIALAEIGDVAAIPALEKAAGDSVPRVAKIAQESLEALRALDCRGGERCRGT